MIFLEYYQQLKQELVFIKQQEIQKKVKRQIQNSDEHLQTVEPPRKIIDVKIGQDGGIRTYLEGGREPIRGYPDQNSVNIVTIYKRLVPLIIGSIEKQGWFKRIITVLALKYNIGIASDWFRAMFDNNYLLLREICWTQPVKEVRRVLKGKIDDQIINAISLVLEYDSAYRYRFQDIMAEVNKSNDTVKEVKRLLDILASRDYDFMQLKWKRFKKFVNVLYIMPKTKKLITSILQDLNIDEVKMSKEDSYWTNTFPTFKYKGLTLEERLKLNEVG